MNENNDSMYNVYSELTALVGYENMIKIYNYYKGQQIHFPQRVYKTEYIKKYIAENTSLSTRDIAKKFQYSERWIQMLKHEGTTIC